MFTQTIFQTLQLKFSGQGYLYLWSLRNKTDKITEIKTRQSCFQETEREIGTVGGMVVGVGWGWRENERFNSISLSQERERSERGVCACQCVWVGVGVGGGGEREVSDFIFLFLKRDRQASEPSRRLLPEMWEQLGNGAMANTPTKTRNSRLRRFTSFSQATYSWLIDSVWQSN